jgi:D-serine deaminase-like pyridoxal phosphate-dependent protein
MPYSRQGETIMMTWHRRRFLTSGALGLGMVGLGGVPPSAAGRTGWGASKRTDPVGREVGHKDDLPTPALLVDLDHLQANIQKLADHCRTTGCAVRPHAKTHKCPEIARLQVAAGARGVAVATVPEAEAMVAAGIPGVLLTSPIVDVNKVARMVALAKKDHTLMMAVGHPREVDLLAEAAAAAQVRLNILVDLDVGDRRSGILPGPAALELAERIDGSKWLRIRGLQAYSGRSSHVIGFSRRKKTSQDAMNQAVETRERLRSKGLDSAILSGGSTGTYNIDSELPGGIELQAGSYVVMDNGYRQIGSRDDDAVYTDFPPSLTVLTSVVSTTHPDRVTVDAGIKAFATDSGGMPQAKDRPGLSYRFSGDEFGQVTAQSGDALPKLGDRLEFYVPHCDPTVNLYDRIYAVRGEAVAAVWPVMARRG